MNVETRVQSARGPNAITMLLSEQSGPQGRGAGAGTPEHARTCDARKRETGRRACRLLTSAVRGYAGPCLNGPRSLAGCWLGLRLATGSA
eukprot:365619-Chlamydomonas_euryale.AAC.15